MKTPVERLIEAVEKGYNSNPVLWEEWKSTLIDAEKTFARDAFFCGDDSEFHLGIKVNSFKEYLEYYNNCK